MTETDRERLIKCACGCEMSLKVLIRKGHVLLVITTAPIGEHERLERSVLLELDQIGELADAIQAWRLQA